MFAIHHRLESCGSCISGATCVGVVSAACWVRCVWGLAQERRRHCLRAGAAAPLEPEPEARQPTTPFSWTSCGDTSPQSPPNAAQQAERAEIRHKSGVTKSHFWVKSQSEWIEGNFILFAFLSKQSLIGQINDPSTEKILFMVVPFSTLRHGHRPLKGLHPPHLCYSQSCTDSNDIFSCLVLGAEVPAMDYFRG